MPDVTWADSFFPKLLRWQSVLPTNPILPLNLKSALDVGCGRGFLGCLLRIYRNPQTLVAIDVFEPYLDFTRRLGVYDSVIKLDLSQSKLPFGDGEFDVVLCLEVIEHLRKEEGFGLLDEMERIGRRVIVSTPGRFFRQPWHDGNPGQAHQAFYSVRDFASRGYRVYGVGDFLVLRRRVPLLSESMSILTYKLPGLSSTILAVKDVG